VSARVRLRRRGDPLMVLGLLLGVWVLIRAATWIAWSDPPNQEADPVWAGGEAPPVTAPPPAAVAATVRSPSSPAIAFIRGPYPTPLMVEPAPRPASPVLPPDLRLPDSPRVAMSPVPPRLAGGHALMWLAAVAQLPGPLALIGETRGQPTVPAFKASSRTRNASPPRWSAEAWALVRGGGGSGAAPFAPTYGGSQVGAVLRYRLAPRSAHRPSAYLRATAALASGGERELAAGLSLRPVSSLPVVVGGEMRLGRIAGATLVRPAVLAVTEFDPIVLPSSMRAEFYLQAGYVGGRGATPFVDGSLRIDRHVAQLGPVEVRAGAGAWGGAQDGAARLDLGPTATLGLKQGRAGARLGLDWRLRVAGEAEPASGPALTISAGF
jgi:hypothetical protein